MLKPHFRVKERNFFFFFLQSQFIVFFFCYLVPTKIVALGLRFRVNIFSNLNYKLLSFKFSNSERKFFFSYKFVALGQVVQG